MSHTTAVGDSSEAVVTSGILSNRILNNKTVHKFGGSSLGTVQSIESVLAIIEQRVNDQFEPENYEDRVRSKMMELIQQKIDGQEIAVPQEAAPEAKIVDLMEALKASVDGKANKSVAKKGGKRKTPARAARKASPTKAQSAPRRKAK